ncbi:uncharacterized protein BN514_01331 [Ruminococcus sp. CAG:17]|nr:uncharacterized protein BN514_01331 [Ruminococcus sp. CAG:17]
MFQKVRDTFLKSLKVLVVEICFCNTTVVFQGTYSCYDNNSTWCKSCHTALDIQELLSTKVSTKTSLCDGIICKLHSHLCSGYGVTSVSDVCEWSAMNNGWNMLQCLNKVWFQGIFQKCCHSTLCMKISCCYRFLLGNFAIGVSDDDSGKSLFQIFDITCQTENCHDLRCYGDVVTVLTRHTVCSSAKSVYYITKLTVVHVNASSPGDLSRVDVQLITLEDMVVDHCSKKVVCRTDCMEITGKMKVDILHRNYLCIAAACRTTFDTEYRSKGWLTKSYHNIFSKSLHSICKTYRCSCFSFPGRCRVDSCHKNQFAVFFVCFFQEIIVDLCFVFTILLQIFVINTCFLCNLGNWLHCALLCNLDVTFKSHNVLLSPQQPSGSFYPIKKSSI